MQGRHAAPKGLPANKLLIQVENARRVYVRGRIGALPWDAPDMPKELRNVRNEYLLKSKNFSCTECGKCCTGSGVVWANHAELEAIRGLIAPEATFEDFHEAYVDVEEMKRRNVDVDAKEWFVLKNADTKLNGAEHCIFLNAETNQCRIYSARPLQCATYPWWPELLSSREWREEGMNVCEGIVLDGDEEDVINDPTRTLTPLDEKLSKLNSFEAYLAEFPHKETYH